MRLLLREGASADAVDGSGRPALGLAALGGRAPGCLPRSRGSRAACGARVSRPAQVCPCLDVQDRLVTDVHLVLGSSWIQAQPCVRSLAAAVSLEAEGHGWLRESLRRELSNVFNFERLQQANTLTST